ncbi:MAG: cyclic nucleotide-binding domain-containing protein [Treponema sp.]|jgi:anti-sigma regulatory factor (Ser/Thr protein kinase)|nr:cyclic nucleotide-binding domain-containing protein [Treponema sp.]
MILGVLNSDPGIKKIVEDAFHSDTRHEYNPRFFTGHDEILEFLNFDLPEIVIINFSDPEIDIEHIISHIKEDKWILNFGIIGLYSNEKDEEEALLKKYMAINLLTMLDNFRIRSHLMKSVQIIGQNYQIIFQQQFTRNLLDGASGAFTIENDLLAVPLFAGIGATILAQRGLIRAENKMHLQLALGELIVNAIEHGNCGITYEEKTVGMENGLSVVDLVALKCKDPLIRGKKVEFQWEIQNDKCVFIIRDEGKGFDVKAHLKKIAKQDMMSLHGRGIRMASLFSSSLSYNGKGNQVTLEVLQEADVEHEVPVGFSKEEVVTVKRGDIVLREDEPSDYIYYIASGTYSVFHNLKKVGSLSPQDIFMGEMAFLLNQRRSASVRADGPGKLILITRRAFVSIVREYPHYGIFLSKLLAKRLVRSNDQNAALMGKLNEKGND